MNLLEKLITIEHGEIGYHEGANNDNKYGIEYGLNNEPWCVIFQWWCAKRAEIPFPNTAHCNGVESYAKEHNQWVTSDYKVGDFIIFDYDFNGDRDHIGLVIEANDGKVITTIEGNYADKVTTVNRVGDTTIIGAYRPDYVDDDIQETEELVEEPETEFEEETSTTADILPYLEYGDIGDAVGSLQVLLRYNGYKMSGSFMTNGTPDCEFGPETESALKDFCGKTTTDDKVWKKLIGGLG